MRKIVAIILCSIGLLLATVMPVAAVSMVIPQSEQEAIAEELRQLYAEGKEAGTYAVTIQYQDGDLLLEKVVYMTIKAKNTIVSGSIAIDAKDVSISGDALQNMTDEEWVRLTEARAWRTDTLDTVSINNVDASQVRPQVGTYPLTVSALDGPSTTVQVSVTSNVININQAYQQNMGASWYETKYPNNPFTFMDYETWFSIVVHVILIIMFLLPLLLLLIHYLITSKVVKQVMYLISR
ncbi:hypothetical protein [Culicoidibacter larvae]|uniref:DUF5011 domain-containing protein n=1 Tax=Culicoidibacter larvae TaxID=2579976 RepID=A0A5R8QAS1_9FIRM|nr:hypothetical protein [Culicoidibacter larvae]TLG72759.1 hypothetical protein FEZ08_08640 [Culicoidibacter larvae]